MIDLAEALGIEEKESPLVEYTFYNGEQTLFFDRDAHVYSRIEDDEFVVVPGVTTVTGCLSKPALVPWASGMAVTFMRQNFDLTRLYTAEEFERLLQGAKNYHRDYKEAAAETGNIAHDWIERYIKAKIAGHTQSEALPEDPRAANACLSFLDWCSEHHVVFVASERKIYSRRYDYAGTLDILAFVDGILCIIDIKTSNSIHRLEFAAQTAAYQHAQEEEHGLDIRQRWIIRLGKVDAEFEALHLTEQHFEHDFTTFLSMLDTHRSVELHKELCRVEKDEAKADAKAAKEALKLAEKAAKLAEKARAKEAKALLVPVKRTRKKAA